MIWSRNWRPCQWPSSNPPTPANRRLLDKARTELDSCLTDETERTLRWARQKWYVKVNKPNAMLANRLRTFIPKFAPIALRTRHNTLTGNPQRVLEEFRHRLTKLYSAPDYCSTQGLDTFLTNLSLSLPSLSETHTSLMDRDIQVSEELQCIKFKVGKRPGPDGFTALYYQKLADVIAPYLTNIQFS